MVAYFINYLDLNISILRYLRIKDNQIALIALEAQKMRLHEDCLLSLTVSFILVSGSIIVVLKLYRLGHL